MSKRIVILGGYGNAGMQIAKLLLERTSAQVVITGRDLQKARRCAIKLASVGSRGRITAAYADTSNLDSLVRAFNDAQLVIVASSTIGDTENVVQAALQSGTDYFDLQLSSFEKWRVLEKYRQAIEDAGRCFITDGGFHPGLAAALIRRLANHFEVLESAQVSCIIKFDWKALQYSRATQAEFIDEIIQMQPIIFEEGIQKTASLMRLPKFDFGAPFGAHRCTPMWLKELEIVTGQIPSLMDTGFYIAGFNWVTDYIIMPVAFSALKLFGKSVKTPMGKLLYWGLRNFSHPPFGTVLQIEATGKSDGRTESARIRLAHEDAYFLTAAPVVACIEQYLQGRIRHPGLWLQANVVDPLPFFASIEEMGVKTTEKLKQQPVLTS